MLLIILKLLLCIFCILCILCIFSQWEQICCHFADNIFKCFFMNGNLHILTQISLKFIPKGQIDNKSSVVQIMTWHCTYKIIHEENHLLKIRVGFLPDKFPPKHSRGPDWCCGLCLLRVSEVWQLFAPDLRRWINSFSGSDFKPRLVYKTLYFVISSQTLASSFRQSNCIHCDKNLSLYCHQNIFCSVAAKG